MEFHVFRSSDTVYDFIISYAVSVRIIYHNVSIDSIISSFFSYIGYIACARNTSIPHFSEKIMDVL